MEKTPSVAVNTVNESVKQTTSEATMDNMVTYLKGLENQPVDQAVSPTEKSVKAPPVQKEEEVKEEVEAVSEEKSEDKEETPTEEVEAKAEGEEPAVIEKTSEQILEERETSINKKERELKKLASVLGNKEQKIKKLDAFPILLEKPAEVMQAINEYAQYSQALNADPVTFLTEVLRLPQDVLDKAAAYGRNNVTRNDPKVSMMEQKLRAQEEQISRKFQEIETEREQMQLEKVQAQLERDLETAKVKYPDVADDNELVEMALQRISEDESLTLDEVFGTFQKKLDSIYEKRTAQRSQEREKTAKLLRSPKGGNATSGKKYKTMEEASKALQEKIERGEL